MNRDALSSAPPCPGIATVINSQRFSASSKSCYGATAPVRYRFIRKPCSVHRSQDGTVLKETYPGGDVRSKRGGAATRPAGGRSEAGHYGTKSLCPVYEGGREENGGGKLHHPYGCLRDKRSLSFVNVMRNRVHPPSMQCVCRI